ncbi:YDG domain-containing protein, partial [Asticcacaulis sp.]|uniref:YDG domain-containing protein n=1 Tax=Asticcacaulis sp. TaxID=1872648 RepID=UPI00391920EA
DSRNAGGRTLTVTGYTLNDGNNGGNYTVTTQTASGQIDKAVLVASLSGSVSRTYDGTRTAFISLNNLNLAGVIGSDNVTLNLPATALYEDASAGETKRVNISGLSLSGSDQANYRVNTDASGVIGRIEKRAILISADDVSKFMGAADPQLTFRLTSGALVAGDGLQGGLNREPGEAAGTYRIGLGSLVATQDYQITFVSGTFTIRQVAMQNAPFVNPILGGMGAPNQPVVMSLGATDSQTANPGQGSKPASAVSTLNASPAASSGQQAAPVPGSQSGSCFGGGACVNAPYPTNTQISSSISFSSR